MSTGFADHFAKVAGAYAGFRRRYPAALYAWLAEIAPSRELAWDCACRQRTSLASTWPPTSIMWWPPMPARRRSPPLRPAKTSPSGLRQPRAPGCRMHRVDLVAVAQALHWFDFDRFYAEVRRVAKPGGVLAVWTYSTLSVEGEDVEARVGRFLPQHRGPVLAARTQACRERLSHPAVPIRRNCGSRVRYAGRFGICRSCWATSASWSSTARFMAARGFDPVTRLEEQVLPLWKDPDARRLVRWPLAIRVARL